jgi:hypothetical protein
MVALSQIGVLTLSFTAKQGIGITGDAPAYIGVADSLLKGQGVSVPYGQEKPYPMAHFPPLFPALLAAVGFFGMDPRDAAKWIQSFLFGANIFLVGYCDRTGGPHQIHRRRAGRHRRRRDVRSNGLLFENKVWPHSEMMKAIEAIPPEVPVFTNGSEIIYIPTDRSYRWLPSRWDPFSLETNSEYYSEIAAMKNELAMNDGRLVYFHRPRYFERRMGSEDELTAMLQLDLVMKSPEESKFGLPR